MNGKDKLNVSSPSQEGYDIVRLQTYNEIRDVIYAFDEVFEPSLSERLSDLDVYAEKLYNNAIVFVAKTEKVLGFIAFYANDRKTNTAYLTQIAVQPTTRNRRVGKGLLNKCFEVSKNKDMSLLKLEVYKDNNKAIRFYERNGFEFCGEASTGSMYMVKKI